MKNEKEIYKSMDRIANAIWDGLRGDGNDYTMTDALFEVSRALNRIADTYANDLKNQAAFHYEKTDRPRKFMKKYNMVEDNNGI